jgi:hypothetical protein
MTMSDGPPDQPGGRSLFLVQPSLRPLIREGLELLSKSKHRWARALEWVIRTRAIVVVPLPFRMAGLTTPLLPVIALDRKFAEVNLAAGATGRARIMQTLLHEAAHQLWAVWPEWRNWLGDRGHYGPERNAADAIAEGVMREMGLPSHYPTREISYVSPLEKVGLLNR